MYELVGYLYCDIHNEGQKPTIGYSCWFLTESESDGFVGRCGVKCFFPTEKFPEFNPEIGGHYLVVFGQNSKKVKAYQKLDHDVIGEVS